VSNNINKIAKLQIDLGSVGSNLIRSIVKKLPIETIDSLKERKDKLVSKMFMKKLELMLEDLPRNLLYRCVRCDALVAAKNYDKTICPKAKCVTDFNG
jgi:hypothetical protein